MTKGFHPKHYLKEGLLAACLLLAAPGILARLGEIEGVAAQGAYLGLLGILWIALIAVAYIPKAPLRWGLAAALAGSAYFIDVFERVMTQFMTYDAFLNMLNSAGFIGDALAQNQSAFLGGLAPALLLLVALGWKPRFRLPVPTTLLVAAPLVGAGMLSVLLFVRAGDGARGLPESYRPIAYLALAGYEDFTADYGPRQDVSIPREDRRHPRQIVLVVDESIAGQYLDINSPQGVPTPLSRAWPGVAIHNFGVAASITTCSIGSNVTLRHGGTRDDYRRINAAMPTIWAYARAAGMRTVYIDSQRTGGAFQNMMDAQERAQIDTFVQFDGVPVVDRDIAAAEELIRQLADPAPKFIMVNKVGAHFPVHDKFPDDHMRYTPSLPRGDYTDVSDTGSRAGFSGSPEDWRRYRNAYRNTLLWNVGEFFDRVLSRADLSDSVLIYTSDHGQDLHENGKPGLWTHCSPYPEAEEGAVPLVILEGDENGQAASGLDWQTAGTTSQYRIFPALLRMMGYREDRVRQEYGPSLADGGRDPGTFNALFNARLGRDPVWHEVHPEELAEAPADDYSATALAGPDKPAANTPAKGTAIRQN